VKLSGEAMLNAAVSQVYSALHDPEILVRTLPGCQRLEQVGAGSYKTTVLAGVAAIKGTFDGDVRLSDQDEPHSFTLHASGAGAPGTVTAVARVALTPGADGTTLLRYDADATIGGVIGGVGQRMISGVARKTAAEFFAAVDRELAGLAGAAVAPVTEPAGPLEAAVPPAAEAAAVAGVEGVGRVWTVPPPAVDLARQRMRDLLVGAAFGALVALLGVLVGAIVAGW
jgi:hypothetical protein